MRVFGTLLFLLFFQHNVSAQDWIPVHKGWVYNYILGSDKNDIHSLYIDSGDVNSGDSTAFLNRVYDPHTYVPLPPSFWKNNIPMNGLFAGIRGNLPEFLGKQMELYHGSLIFTFSSTHKLTLLPHANLSDTWIFDAGNNVTATVSSVGIENIWGAPDSVKVITLSTGEEIHLSKTFGLLQFPDFGHQKYFYLIGLEGPGLGVQIPNLNSIFNFDIGDKFEYLTKMGMHDSLGRPYILEVTDQYVIVSKAFVKNHYYSYTIKGITKYNDVVKPMWDTGLLFSADRSPEINQYPYQFDRIYNPRITTEYSKEYKSYIKREVFNETVLPLEPVYPGCDTLIMKNHGIICSETETIYQPGLGIVYDLLSGITYSERKLVAAQTRYHSFGTFTQFDTASPPPIPNQPAVVVLQNFATNSCLVKYQLPKAANISLTLFDVNGKQIKILESGARAVGFYTHHYDLSDLKPGIYFIEFWDGSRAYPQKVLITGL
jgi:hypothetical protein